MKSLGNHDPDPGYEERRETADVVSQLGRDFVRFRRRTMAGFVFLGVAEVIRWLVA